MFLAQFRNLFCIGIICFCSTSRKLQKVVSTYIIVVVVVVFYYLNFKVLGKLNFGLTFFVVRMAKNADQRQKFPLEPGLERKEPSTKQPRV